MFIAWKMLAPKTLIAAGNVTFSHYFDFKALFRVLDVFLVFIYPPVIN